MCACAQKPFVEKNAHYSYGSVSGSGPHDFVPGRDLIQTIEQKLREQIAHIMKEDTFETMASKDWIISELDHFDRRYVGTVADSNGAKLVRIDFFHQALHIKEEDLVDPLWGIDGGGSNIWSLVYDADKEKFSGFYMNAPI
jgi:hypothetical protein